MKTTYTKKQAKADKALREQYKGFTSQYDKLKFMSEAPTGAIYLCDLHSEAEDMDGAWYPMLGGFQVANGKERFKSETQELALAAAEVSKAEYQSRFAAFKADCAALA